ncbi:MAG: PLP-dependent aminotransferase family protein, partial [Clostridia bacterium]
MGHPVRSVPIDDCGLPVESLAGLTDAAVYLTPAHQFPLGITMPISRRIELLNWAGAKSGRYLIEDDYDSEFRYNSKPVPAMKSIDSGGRVIYLGSFSRTISPALRISYMVLPETLIDDYRVCCAPFGCCVSKLDQLVLTRFLAGGHFEGHLNKMRKVYRERRAHLVAALECAFHGRIEIHGICAGQHVPIRISGLSEDELIARARRAGVKIYPISPYFIEGVPRKYAGVVLIGYGTLAEDEIDEGITRLKTVW